MQVTDTSTIDRYYDALCAREQQFVGTFYVGVKTTAVFCIATCRARKPKKENVLFYTHFKDALDNGFRPCKICKPTENSNEAPSHIVKAISLVKDHPKEKITDARLRENGLTPAVIRRWFNAHYGMTFHAFQRMFRINTAFEELQKGKKATTTAFDMGYESLSGFGYTFKKVTGNSPKNAERKTVILIHRFTTPLGPMFACATQKGICLLEFVDRKMLETEFQDLQKRLNAIILIGENDHIKQVKQEITAYFAGTLKKFTVPIHTPGTEFQNSVWNALQEIPYGVTTTYQKQATHLKTPKGVRAIGRANGMNRVAIIIPCHRVIGSNGELMGYGGGLERKKWLLSFEKNQKK